MAVLALSSLLLLASPTFASDIAGWYGQAVTQIQTKIFLTGGYLAWGNWSDANGGYGSDVSLDIDFLTGLLYSIDLTESINISRNDTSDYVIKSDKPMNTAGYPGYSYGALFSDKYSWFTFGGLATADVDNTAISTVTRGREFCQGCSQGANQFTVTVTNDQPVTSPVSEYITNGAYTSSPTLSLAWWFGGLISSNKSAPIEVSPVDPNSNGVSQTSRDFIEATLSTDGNALISFQYRDKPDWLAGRAEAALTWLPYGAKGMLVLIGGVDRPADILTEDSGNPANNTFMTELAIYDVDKRQWYNQSTLESGTNPRPTQLASFCTAVVPTADGNGHEIFVYGGYDGTWATSTPYDDVWVLSVPAFQWTKVYDGSKTSPHARMGNSCIAPNPSTLMTIGGMGAKGAYLTAQHGVDIFDLNTMSWTGNYDASSKELLNLPQKVITQIGGSATGPGSSAQPSGLSSGVASLISNPFTQEVETYYPYANASNTTTSPTASPTNTPNPTPSNHTLAIALGVVIPVVVIAALIIGFCCLKKRRKNKEGAERTQQSRGNVFSWLGKSSANDPAPEKSHTSDETAVDGTEYTHDKQQPMSQIFEAPGSNPTTPGWGTYASGQTSPQVLSGTMATSPFLGSVEVDAQSRHEIMDHAPRDGQSLRQHHMYPRSLSGDQVMSMRSDSISHASTSVMPSRHYGYVSPSYELPQEHSREDLAVPAADVNLGAPHADANASTHSLGLGAEHVHSPVALLPVAPISRKPMHSAAAEDNRPGHQRNQSSMSSDLPNLPSPGPEEDRRRSRLIDTLPDPKSTQASPIQPTQPQTTQTAKRSIYKEDLDS